MNFRTDKFKTRDREKTEKRNKQIAAQKQKT